MLPIQIYSISIGNNYIEYTDSGQTVLHIVNIHTCRERAGSDIGDGAEPAASPDELVPINPSRFQVLHVPAKCSIKEFVQNNYLLFKAGRGFYEFTNPELISNKKEVVLVDKATADMFTGRF